MRYLDDIDDFIVDDDEVEPSASSASSSSAEDAEEKTKGKRGRRDEHDVVSSEPRSRKSIPQARIRRPVTVTVEDDDDEQGEVSEEKQPLAKRRPLRRPKSSSSSEEEREATVASQTTPSQCKTAVAAEKDEQDAAEDEPPPRKRNKRRLRRLRTGGMCEVTCIISIVLPTDIILSPTDESESDDVDEGPGQTPPASASQASVASSLTSVRSPTFRRPRSGGSAGARTREVRPVQLCLVLLFGLMVELISWLLPALFLAGEPEAAARSDSPAGCGGGRRG